MEVGLHSCSNGSPVFECPTFEETISYHQHEHLSSNNRGCSSSSRFKGVILLNSGKWGARISYRYQPYWLGAHENEQDAAIAYDRAAIKLQRTDVALNFPWTDYSTQESMFQSNHSVKEILHMIKDQTYESNFLAFIKAHSSVEPTQVFDLTNEAQISYQLLFQKELTHSDIANKTFLIPKDYALQYFPPLTTTSSDRNEEKRKSIKLTFYDRHCRSWSFQYSYWKSSRSFLFTMGWERFLRMNNLNHKDIVFFYVRDNGDQSVCYMIDAQRKNEENSAIASNMMKDNNGLRRNFDNVTEVDGVREETDRVVKLFGVLIG
ncbi:AP2/ERF and B3 domain-containing transcription factor At1g51120-like [Juglans microcarpa x Juglans regia]|uniref:AP2/ERF and B3 domain-containing transcription factor At1g51120-like n=1 Tax=Juglans microcarpa x Juglans regia TaxID=2249226 RepID=UPI001B7F21CB|nr:AP2/ERF and B3 domain-containing transcription factor At1g51120-like [Juglans microcarpa x Juglans regia]